MKDKIIKKLKAFAIRIFGSSGPYRYGTRFKIGYGRCYCIERRNFLGIWMTVFETDNKQEWTKVCLNDNHNWAIAKKMVEENKKK